MGLDDRDRAGLTDLLEHCRANLDHLGPSRLRRRCATQVLRRPGGTKRAGQCRPTLPAFAERISGSDLASAQSLGGTEGKKTAAVVVHLVVVREPWRCVQIVRADLSGVDGPAFVFAR